MNWQKYLDIIKKTGDRLIVVDKEEGEAFAIMSLSEYEALVAKMGSPRTVEAEEEGLLYREKPDEEAVAEKIVSQDLGDDYHLDEPGLSEEERFYLEPIE
jgi:hypothetical protein